MKTLLILHIASILPTAYCSLIRFVCPRPVSSRSDISEKLLDNQSNCGQDPSFTFKSEYKDVTPGPMTVRFEETVVQKDSPFSISLYDYEDNTTSCLLLDQIPHNNAASVSRYCHVAGYPIGTCKGSTYYITINIPNIRCEKCYLKLKSIHLSDESESCSNNDSCKVYYSCANIRIRPTITGNGNRLEACQNYADNLLGKWPYRPRKYFKAELTTAAKNSPVLGTAIYDVVMNSIDVGLPRPYFISGLSKVALSTLKNSTSVPPEYDIIYSSPVGPGSYHSSLITIPFTNVSEAVIELLTSGLVYLNVFTDDADYIGLLQLKHQEKEEGNYEPSSIEYSPNGWLQSSEFVGERSVYPAAIYPTGPCSPTPRHFISRLYDADDNSNTIGILAMTVLDSILHIIIKLSTKYQKIDNISLLSPELMDPRRLSVPVNKLNNGQMYTTFHDTTIINRMIGSLKFLKTIEMKYKDEIVIKGIIEEGIYSYMGNINNIHGLGIYQFTQGGWLQYTILMKHVQCGRKSLLLQGPGTVVIKNLTKEMQLKDGETIVEGYLKDLSSDMVLYLWNNQVTINMRCEDDNNSYTEIIGKLTEPGDWYCQDIEGVHCSVVKLTPGETTLLDGDTFLPPSGLASFVLERAKVLQYSIYIGDVTKRGLLVATLMDEDHLILSINLRRSQTRDKVFEARGQLPQSSPDLIQALLLGRLKLHVTNPGLGTTPLRGSLPIVERNPCIESKAFIVGEDKELWSSESAPFKPLHALVGDKLVFIYDSNTTVHLFTTQEDFESCNLKKGRHIEGYTKDNITWTLTYQLNEGTTYFASETQCDVSPPFKLAVSSIVNDKHIQDQDVCSSSLYQLWRQEQLNRYQEPSLVFPAFGGILSGICILGILFFVNRKTESTRQNHDSGFQRF